MDVVLDLMIHDLDIILSLVGSEIISIHALGVPVMTSRIDIANARLVFANGCVANITASRISMKTMRKIRVFQPNAYLSVDYAKRDMTMVKKVAGGTELQRPHRCLPEQKTYEERDALEDELALSRNRRATARRLWWTGPHGRARRFKGFAGSGEADRQRLEESQVYNTYGETSDIGVPDPDSGRVRPRPTSMAPALVREITARVPDVEIFGVGGGELRAAGVERTSTCRPVVMGTSETLGAMGRVYYGLLLDKKGAGPSAGPTWSFSSISRK